MSRFSRNGIFRTALILVLGVLIGAVFTVSSSASWLGDILNEDKTPVPSTPPASAITRNVVIGPTGLADIVDRVSPAVVNIEAMVKTDSGYIDPFFNDPFFREFFGDRFKVRPRSSYQTSLGTGCIISADGYVLTNQHVVHNAEKIEVQVSNVSKPIPASIVGQDYELDLAVLKLQSDKKFSTLKMGDSDSMRVGEWVIAIGNPYGLDHTVTVGVVSAKGRPITIEDRQYKNLIQTDAAINPGNSGGPLLSLNGEIIGINTAVSAQAQGIGFAIPINTAKQVMDQLISKGKVIRPYMGLNLREVTPELAQYLGLPVSKGVLVDRVMPDTPAERAGLQQGDIIIKMDGKEISNYSELKEILDRKKVGQELKLEVLRNNQRLPISMVLAEKP